MHRSAVVAQPQRCAFHHGRELVDRKTSEPAFSRRVFSCKARFRRAPNPRDLRAPFPLQPFGNRAEPLRRPVFSAPSASWGNQHQRKVLFDPFFPQKRRHPLPLHFADGEKQVRLLRLDAQGGKQSHLRLRLVAFLGIRDEMRGGLGPHPWRTPITDARPDFRARDVRQIPRGRTLVSRGNENPRTQCPKMHSQSPLRPCRLPVFPVSPVLGKNIHRKRQDFVRVRLETLCRLHRPRPNQPDDFPIGPGLPQPAQHRRSVQDVPQMSRREHDGGILPPPSLRQPSRQFPHCLVAAHHDSGNSSCIVRHAPVRRCLPWTSVMTPPGRPFMGRTGGEMDGGDAVIVLFRAMVAGKSSVWRSGRQVHLPAVSRCFAFGGGVAGVVGWGHERES